MAIKISGETVVDDSKKGLFNDVVVKGGAGESGEITLNCENNSHGVKLKGPAHSANADYTLTLPNTSGNNGEVLTTDGTGAMSWEEVVGNEISTTAPTDPSVGAMWTDTSEDPSTPLLKTWNGSAWVTVGSATPSEFAPVINSVSLTENDPTGDRFTSQSFDVDINMLVEGSPHSQKALKGEVTADFSVYPNSDPVASNAVITYPNSSRTIFENGGESRHTRAFLPTPTGGYAWYFIRRRYGGSEQIEVYGNAEPGTTNGDYIFSGGPNSCYPDRHTHFKPTALDPNYYLFAYPEEWTGDNANIQMKLVPGSNQWNVSLTGNYCSPPCRNDATNLWCTSYSSWTGAPAYAITVRFGPNPFTLTTSYLQVTSSADDGYHKVAFGNNKFICIYKDNYGQNYSAAIFNADGTYVNTVGISGLSGGNLTFFKFVNGYFWAFSTGSNFVRSADGVTWTSMSTPTNISSLADIIYDTSSNKFQLFTAYSTYVKIYESNNYGVNWIEADSYNEGNRNIRHVTFGDSKVVWYGTDSSRDFNETVYPFNAQTLTLSGTGGDYSDFNVNDTIRPAGQYGAAYEGIIKSISGTSIEVSSDYIYQVGDVVEAKFPTSSAVSTRYLVIDATGAISGTVGSDPGYVSVGPDTSQTLTFPATFASGDSPDEELPAGTTIKVSAQATNSEGSSEYGPSNVVTPS